MTSTDKLAGSFLPLDLTDQDPQNIWWGWLSMERSKDPTFIPYVSALDIDGSQSAFDYTIESSAPHYHDQLPSDVAQDLLEEFGVLPAPLAAWIQGPASIGAGIEGTWQASAAGGTAPYAFQWDYMILCSSIDPLAFSGAQLMEVTCDQWHSGGSATTFSRSVSGDAMLKIRLVVNDDASSSKTVYKMVTVGTGGGEVFARGDEYLGGVLAEAKLRSNEVHVESAAYSLEQNYPNPFKVTTEIPFSVGESGSVSLVVYDVMGREIARLLDHADIRAGYHSIVWEASGQPTGVYVVRFQSGEYIASRQITMVR